MAGGDCKVCNISTRPATRSEPISCRSESFRISIGQPSNCADPPGCPHIEAALHKRPLILGVLFIASLLVTFQAQHEAKKGHAGRPFFCSCFSTVSLMLLFAAAVYP